MLLQIFCGRDGFLSLSGTQVSSATRFIRGSLALSNGRVAPCSGKAFISDRALISNAGASISAGPNGGRVVQRRGGKVPPSTQGVGLGTEKWPGLEAGALLGESLCKITNKALENIPPNELR